MKRHLYQTARVLRDPVRAKRTETQTRREISLYLAKASTRRCAATIPELRPRYGASA